MLYGFFNGWLPKEKQADADDRDEGTNDSAPRNALVEEPDLEWNQICP